MYNKNHMHLDAWYKSTDFAIIITITVNARGFGAFLTKYMYNRYIYILIIAYIRIFSIYTYICLKCTKFLKINAGNSLSATESSGMHGKANDNLQRVCYHRRQLEFLLLS